jgi:uncharacterized protein YndB with AHSA1/START domain
MARSNQLERTYPTSREALWELWTTAAGIESWWAPDGFEVEVDELELRPGGRLAYTMTAIAPEQIAFMRSAGLPLSTRAEKTFTEVDAPRRLAYDSLVDFVPGVEPYAFATIVDLEPAADAVKVTMTVESMHDEEWTQRLLAGRANELDNLATAIEQRLPYPRTSARDQRLALLPSRHGRIHGDSSHLIDTPSAKEAVLDERPRRVRLCRHRLRRPRQRCRLPSRATRRRRRRRAGAVRARPRARWVTGPLTDHPQQLPRRDLHRAHARDVHRLGRGRRGVGCPARLPDRGDRDGRCGVGARGDAGRVRGGARGGRASVRTAGRGRDHAPLAAVPVRRRGGRRLRGGDGARRRREEQRRPPDARPRRHATASSSTPTRGRSRPGASSSPREPGPRRSSGRSEPRSGCA